MRGVADAQKTRPMPQRQAIDRNAQELEIVHALKLQQSIGWNGRQRRDFRAQSLNAGRLEGVGGAL
ncbi:MAG: hypothetical protein ACLPYS_12170, partial [Vulcanimicrobiaceae bacterium]